MHEIEVIKKYKEWNKVKISEEMKVSAVSFLKSQLDFLDKNWIGYDGDAPYVQTHEKIEKYLEIIQEEFPDKSIANEVMDEVEARVLGLYKNWREVPDDKCIPVILENYLYIRKLLERKAGYIINDA